MIEVYTLGQFKLTVDGEVVSNHAARTQKLWKLLNLLLANRNKPLSIPYIIDSIWFDDNTGDSARALHNLLFRLRKVLGGASGKNYISFTHNSYSVITDEDFFVDIYELEDCYAALNSTRFDSPGEKTALLQKITSLYNGKYLMDSYVEPWALSLVNKYKRMYIEAVETLANIYMEQKRFGELIALCEKAISLEPLEEIVYEKLIKCFQINGQKVQAIQLCENLFDLLYRELGVGPTDAVNNIYKELKSNVYQAQHDIANVLEEFTEQKKEKMAVACNLDTFKSIYRYEVRQSKRRGEAVFVMLLSINDARHDVPAPQVLAKAMTILFNSCLQVLRSGDLVANYSNSQIILLLTRLVYEDGETIINRVKKKFHETFTDYGDVVIRFETKPMKLDIFDEI
ncbi:MAG: bacterial transcriptional activator domain-containing protein [Defluviitaleaceae bacterium]|nr:bacterial transcriptional activator domain-containing protein [Defluviitaleaceae bacterium]